MTLGTPPISITPGTKTHFRTLENLPRPGIDYHVVAKEKQIRVRFEGICERARCILPVDMFNAFFTAQEIFFRSFHLYIGELYRRTHKTIANGILDLVCRSIKLPTELFREIAKGRAETLSGCYGGMNIGSTRNGQCYQILKRIWRKIFPKPVKGKRKEVMEVQDKPAQTNCTHFGGGMEEEVGISECRKVKV